MSPRYKMTHPITGVITEITLMDNPQHLSSDPILRELVEETIAKSHREWRSIPETALLVLRAIEDYGVGK